MGAPTLWVCWLAYPTPSFGGRNADGQPRNLQNPSPPPRTASAGSGRSRTSPILEPARRQTANRPRPHRMCGYMTAGASDSDAEPPATEPGSPAPSRGASCARSGGRSRASKAGCGPMARPRPPGQRSGKAGSCRHPAEAAGLRRPKRSHNGRRGRSPASAAAIPYSSISPSRLACSGDTRLPAIRSSLDRGMSSRRNASLRLVRSRA